MKQSSKYFLPIAVILIASCGGSDQKRKTFDTEQVLSTAKSNIQLAFESVELRASIKKLAPSQRFYNLGQFYGYAYNFGMPGCKEWELSDGWRRSIRFSIDGDVVHVWSIGPDGINQFGEGDDIKIVIHIENQSLESVPAMEQK